MEVGGVSAVVGKASVVEDPGWVVTLTWSRESAVQLKAVSGMVAIVCPEK